MIKWTKGAVLHRESPFIAMLTKENIKLFCNYCFGRLGKHKIGKI